MTGPAANTIRAIEWLDGLSPACRLLDQTALPVDERYIDVTDPDGMRDAIRRLVVRGAPAIGIAAAYGVVLGVLAPDGPPADGATAATRARAAIDRLRTSRPTAVNLFNVLDRVQTAVDTFEGDGPALAAHLLALARTVHDEDRELCAAIGRAGADLIADGAGVLTHCNTGALATGGIGTALGVIATAHKAGRRFRVLACETRPLLQGARLTAWELQKLGVEMRLITDSMAGHCMRRGMVDAVIVGADRIVANGDTANKIGTYAHAVLARHHGIPFYVAAPLTSFDVTLPAGDRIEIEERAAEEVTRFGQRPTAPDDTPVFAPAFDVTPGELIAGIVTEAGILRPPYKSSIAAAVAAAANAG